MPQPSPLRRFHAQPRSGDVDLGVGQGWTSADRLRVERDGGSEAGSRPLAEETPVAVVYDAATYAVMMATPCDLEDFAVGFSLCEGVIADPGEIEGMEVVEAELGLEARIWLKPGPRRALAERRRRLAGPTGCGLCGIDSLAEAARPPAHVGPGATLTSAQVFEALGALEPAQSLGRRTRAAHAAAFWRPDRGLVALREDVGRHNALDKLAGALRRFDEEGAAGAVVLTSRVSVEMVQKASVIGAGVLIAVSAPTTLAVRTAEAAGITLVGVARADGFEVFSQPRRVAG